MYIEHKPSLNVDDLKEEFKESIDHINESEEALEMVVGFVALEQLYS